MIIKNLTKSTQTLWIKNLLTGDTASVQVLATEPRELGRAYIPDKSMMKNFDQIFEMVGYPRQKDQVQEEKIVKSEEPVQEIVEEAPEVEETLGVEEAHEPESLEDKFICDVCGEEFASARGLAAHKNRSHKE